MSEAMINFPAAFKRTSIKAFTDNKVTPVVLVCIYNQSNAVITHDILYEAFCPYGKILRILMFEKMKVWKAFVEYDSVQSSIEATRNLNDAILFDDGTRMNVYFSNTETIRFQNGNSGGRDYTLDDYQQADSAQEDSNLKTSAPLARYLSFNSLQSNGLMLSISTTQSTSQLNLRGPTFDDKDDEILDIINEHYDENQNHDSTANQLTAEENKADVDENDAYTKFFADAFRQNPSESHEDRLSCSKAYSSLSLNSQSFGGNIQDTPQEAWQQSEEQQGWQQEYDQAQIQQNGSQNSFYSYEGPKSATLSHYGDYTRSVTSKRSFTQMPYNKPSEYFTFEEPQTFINRKISNLTQFRSMDNIPTNFGSKYQQSNYSTMNDESQYNANLRSSHRHFTPPFISRQNEAVEDNRLNPNEPSYEGLVSLIENDIIQANNNSSGSVDLKRNNFKTLLQEYFSRSGNKNLAKMDIVHLNQLYNELSLLLRKDDLNKKSSVLYVKGLEKQEITVQMIYNIFSNFGNVLKIIFARSKASAVIEFENTEQSTHSKDYLSNLPFMGNSLRIFYSNYSILNSRTQDVQETQEEVYTGNSKSFKFKKNKAATINPPSLALHVSNFAREACNEETIRNYFEIYGRVEAIRLNIIENRCTSLLRMGSIEESLLAIAYLNDIEISGRRIQVSFTRCKI